MKYLPKSTKFEKSRKKLKFPKTIKNNHRILRNTYQIRTNKQHFVTLKLIETLRQIITKSIKPRGKIWFHLNFNYIQFKHSTGTRQGKGKGNFDKYLAPLKPHQNFIEFQGCNLKQAKKIFAQCKYKTNLNLTLETNLLI